MTRIRIGIISTTIQAPDRNLVNPTMRAMTRVVDAPSPLTNSPRRQAGSRRRHHRTTMPPCERVNAMNTPNVYRGMSAVTDAPKARSRPAARSERATMPVVNARRSPR